MFRRGPGNEFSYGNRFNGHKVNLTSLHFWKLEKRGGHYHSCVHIDSVAPSLRTKKELSIIWVGQPYPRLNLNLHRADLFPIDVLAQNSPYFLDCFVMALRRVTGTHDFFRLNAFNVRAPIGNHAVGLAGDRAFTDRGDD